MLSFLTALQQKRSDQVMTHREAVLGMLGLYLKGEIPSFLRFVRITRFMESNEATF